MRATALLAVFVIAKIAALAGRHIELSAWTPLAYFWQDALAALALGALDRAINKPWLGWTIYCAAVCYIAINVAVERVLWSPLTWPMIGAARGALSDSIKHHATLANLALVSLVAAAGFGLPWLLARIRYPARAVIATALLIVGLGPFARTRVDTLGLDRNPLLALITTALPRLGTGRAALASAQSWRASPFEDVGQAGTLSLRSGDCIAEAHTQGLSNWRGAANGRNVVLILLESAAAEYLRPYGAPSDPMPSLSELARSSLVFENAYAVYPESIKGLFSVLCSRYPAMDTESESYASIKTPALASVLRAAGYHTALFHSGRFMYLGMEAVVQNRGFEILEDAGDISGNHQSSFGVDEPSTVARALAWVDSLAPNQPFLMTYLPIAGHHPYDTPDPGPFPERREQDRYLNALYYADSSLRLLIEGLRNRQLDRNSLFVIFGDHGEAFGRHPGNYAHSQFIYEENVHVPYFIAMPGAIDRQVRVTRPISLIDTAPTILDLLGLGTPNDYQGASVLESRHTMALFYTDYSLGFLGLRDGSWKYIYELESRKPKLFDLSQDPTETIDLSSQQPDRVAAYRNLLLDWSKSQRALIRSDAAAN
jgi:arylsulfatase A-like enzyme